MQARPLTYDGLWRCLCPSISKATLASAARTTVPVRTASTKARSASRRFPERRCYTAASQVSEVLASPSAGRNATRSTSVRAQTVATQPTASIAAPRSHPDTYTDLPARRADIHDDPSISSLLLAKETSDRDLRSLDVHTIHKALLTLRQSQGFDFGVETPVYDRIIHLCTYLITQQGHHSDIFVYECLMDAMADPWGSSVGAQSLWQDMEKQKLKPSEIICRSALRVCAVHPDYTFRQYVEDTMRDQWFEMRTGDHQNIIMAMMREGQEELAYGKYLDLAGRAHDVDAWFFDVMIMALGYKEYVPEMLEVLSKRRDRFPDEGREFWNVVYFVLDKCSAAFHYEGTALLWDLGVTKGEMELPDAVLENVLNTAARGGDSGLAATVYEKISSRTRIMPDHQHALIESFARAGDFPGVFDVLSILKGYNFKITDLEPVINELARRIDLIDDAEKAIRKLGANGEAPILGLELVMCALAQARDAMDSMRLYQDAPTLCGQGPSRLTMRRMIKHSMSPATALAYADDYAYWFPHEDQDPIDHITSYTDAIPNVLEAQDLDLAMRFARQALIASRGNVDEFIRSDWLGVLFEENIGRGDGAMKSLLKKMAEDSKDAHTAKGLVNLIRMHEPTESEALVKFREEWQGFVDSLTSDKKKDR